MDLVDTLAQADEHELVKTFKEVNAAFFPINSDALSLQLDTCVAFSREEHTALVARVRGPRGAMRDSPAVRVSDRLP